jgi:hypothetical protein
MQLDHTRIAVRERSLLDTFDLALHVVRRGGFRLAASFLAGALPLLILNYLLVGWMITVDRPEGFFYLDDAGLIARFVWNMALLVVIEAPLASVFTVAYLGQAMFIARPAWKPIFLDVVRMWPRILWCQVLVRGVLAAWLLVLSLDRGGDFDGIVEISGLGTLVLYVCGLRFWRPFIMEIVLLERNPLSGGPARTLTVARRSGQLHGPSAGDLFARSLGSATLAILLTLSVSGTFVFCTGVFLNDWQPGPWMWAWLFPLAMWIVAYYLTVVRFLSYLDLRIRHEGWEVELRMRAEGVRLRNVWFEGASRRPSRQASAGTAVESGHT